MAVRLSALRTDRPLPPGRFLVLISVRGLVDPRAIVRLKGLGQLKEIHLIGNGTRDIPACSIVPQSSMLWRVLVLYQKKIIITVKMCVGLFLRYVKLLRKFERSNEYHLT
jgi:hypothetical protein